MFARTPTERAMWDAIMAEPENDAPRLVYADALQQRGEPLGEFIALECHPTFTSDPALRERSRALYAANSERWAEEVGVKGAILSFERGLPHVVRVDFSADALSIVDRVPVRFVRFYGSGSLEATRSITRDPRLARIFTISSWGDEAATRLLIESPHFVARRLFVEGRACTNGVAEALAVTPLPQLSELVFSGSKSPMNALGLRAIARSTLQLRKLMFSHLEFEPFALHHFNESALPLEELSLTFMGELNAGVPSFTRSRLFSKLVSLTISSGQLDDSAFGSLARAKDVALRTLDVALNRLRHASLEALGEGLPKLEALDLGYSSLSAPGLERFVTTPLFARLRTLSLHAAMRSAAPAIAIARPPNALRELNLRDCRGRDEAAFALAGSEHLGSLEVLSFYGNKVTDAGRKALIDRFGDRVRLD